MTALDVAGLREQDGVNIKDHKDHHISMSEASYTTHADGSTNGPALCAAKFEKKYRGDHRPGIHWSTGVSFAGEVHICEWRSVKPYPTSIIDDGECEAGMILTICPEEDVVETEATGGQGLDATPPSGGSCSHPTGGGGCNNFAGSDTQAGCEAEGCTWTPR